MNKSNRHTENEIGYIARVSVHDLTPEIFHREYRLPGKPVIITHALDAVIPLEIKEIKQAIGELKVPIRYLGAGHFNKPKTEWKSRSDVREGTVGEYCDLLESGTAGKEQIYLGAVDLTDSKLYEIVGPCIDYLGKKTGLRDHIPTNTNLWFAPSGHLEPLHLDGRDGTLFQLRGDKRISLFSPKQTKNLYPFPIKDKRMPPNFSQPYIDAPDFDKYPKLEKALKTRITTILAEGETVYIPLGWWHEIEALGDDYICSINRFWQVDPAWRVFTAPRASFFYGLFVLGQWMHKRKNKK